MSKPVATTRSTVAPSGMRPVEGTLTTIFDPSAPSAPSPPTARLPCAIAYICPSAPSSGVRIRLPPRRLLALPIEATVMSSRWPGLAKGGSSAVISTTAAFFIPGLAPGGRCSPKRESMALSDWTE